MDLADVPRHRPLAFDKMESLIKEMQDSDSGVPVRSQKLFLTFIPSAFMGYDLVEWLMDRFNLEDNVEAINLANQLCQYGYFFPVNDSKNLILKDDSSLYRFQSPYYWPWAAPRAVCGGGPGTPAGSTDNLEYAIYLVKRTLRNKQRHGLEEYELEALANLRKNLAAKWDSITMQAEEQVRIGKDRKKGDKIVSDSQERAYWRVARPPPGLSGALECCPVPARTRQPKPRKRTLHQLNKEVELLRASLDRTRVKVSVALEALLSHSETFVSYDPCLVPPQPSNPWVTDDTFFWQINSPIVETPTEKRLQRWTLSMEELVADPTGLQEFTSFLRKEYSHENIRFWLAVVDLRRGSHRHVQRKLNEIYEEFLKPGAPCEINIDGATMERVGEAIRTGSRFALDHAAEHVYSLLLKKDCYPRFVRSEHFRILAQASKNVQHKKRFFGFGGPVKKKSTGSGSVEARSGMGRRRGSDRSLSGSAHELAVCGTHPAPVYAAHPHAPPPHSHSQSNLSDLPYSRETDDEGAEATPWECATPARRRKDSVADSGSSSSDLSGVAVTERMRRLPQQSTLDGGLRGAPPPLRRLSAVEPRHLAPLISPSTSPHSELSTVISPSQSPAHLAASPARSDRTIQPPQPAPTISVSSAPDDESLAEATMEEESNSRECTDDPPSVFTASSREHSPPDLSDATLDQEQNAAVQEFGPPAITVAPTDDPSAPDKQHKQTPRVQEASEAATVNVQDNESVTANTGVVTANTSVVTANTSVVTANTSVATASAVGDSNRKTIETHKVKSESGKMADIPVSVGRIEKAGTVVKSETTREPLTTPATTSIVTKPATEACGTTGPRPITVLTPESTPAASATGKCGSEKAGTVEKVGASEFKKAAPCDTGTAERGGANDRAGAADKEGGADKATTVAPLAESEDVGPDEEENKVPSVPPTDAEPGVARNDNNGGRRNDVCPWEDENSCESDAPFVKTYATLGYL